jgi:GntR family transcriptional regulator
MTDWSQIPPVDREDPRPLYAQLSEALSRFILSKKMSPGDLFPTEMALVQHFAVSRMTVRQAMQHLETQGIVRKVQGKGTYVAVPPGRKYVKPFKSLEATLESQNVSVTNKVLMLIESPPPVWALDLGFPNLKKVKVVKRLKVIDGQPLALEFRTIELEASLSIQQEDYQHRSIFFALNSKPGTAILRVSYTISGGGAAGEEAAALGVPAGTPVLVRQGLYFDGLGRIIMASRIVFVGEKFELQFEFHKKDENWGTVRLI